VDLRPNRRNKAVYAFLNSYDVVWTESGANHDVNEHHQTKGLMSKPKAVQVCSVNLLHFIAVLCKTRTQNATNVNDESNC